MNPLRVTRVSSTLGGTLGVKSRHISIAYRLAYRMSSALNDTKKLFSKVA